MKQRGVYRTRRLLAFAAALVMALALLPAGARAATYEYAVDGGNLKFDPTTGTITGYSGSVYNADIPGEIYGVPVRVIGKSAFSGCSKLVSVTIPTSVTRIEAGAFYNCNQLFNITIPSSVTELGSKDSVDGVFEDCHKLETITIPGSITALNQYLFSGCTELREVKLNEGLEKIGYHVFYCCNNLKTIELPDSLKSIEGKAFDTCSVLETIIVGKNVNYIDSSAFYNCPELSMIVFRGSAPATGNNIVNKFATGFTIYYPEGASGWTTPTWNGYITKSYKPETAETAPAAEPEPAPAVTTAPADANIAHARTQTIDLDGKMLILPTYALVDSNGNETNFVRLRDIAYVMNGTAARFNVGWDGAVNIAPKTDYAPVGGELKTPFTGDRAYQESKAETKIDGQTVALRAILLTDDTGGGYTYYKLRDLGEALGFNVGWSAERGIYIESNKPYMGQ